MELEVENEAEWEAFQISFVHASINAGERQGQWEQLQSRRQYCGSDWLVAGDFNEIKNQGEKKGGKARQEGSFSVFRSFISKIEMEDFDFKGDVFTVLTTEKEKATSKKGWTDFMDLKSGLSSMIQQKGLILLDNLPTMHCYCQKQNLSETILRLGLF